MREGGGPGSVRVPISNHTEDEPDPHHPGPPASLSERRSRSIRRTGGTACRRTAPSRRQADRERAYLDKYIWLVKKRLPQLAKGTAAWWLESRPFFGGLQRERIWVFWRRVLHTCHHRTQVQTWLRLAGHEPVPAIYGPSGDMKWDEADPTYSVEAAKKKDR